MGHIRNSQHYPRADFRVSGQKMRNFGGFIIFLKQEKKGFLKCSPATTNNIITAIHFSHLRCGHMRHCLEDIEDISFFMRT